VICAGKCRRCGCTDARACGLEDFWVEPDLCAFCKAGSDLGVKAPLSSLQRRLNARRVA